MDMKNMNKKYIMREFDTALNKIYMDGFDIMGDRTGVGTRAYFGLTTRYDISERVPILTKRKVAWRSIVKEILWIISGSDNINDLEQMGSGIWTPWKDSEFTSNGGFVEGSIGYGYGPNLRNYGGDLNGDVKGVDQLQDVVDLLSNISGRKSRRILFTLWRPDKLGKYDVKLPPCHHTYQFLVSPDENGEMKNLSCFMYQRSADYPIGVGMGNLLGGTLFTYMLAQQCDLKPKELIHSASHCHIYHNAMEATSEYLSRTIEPNSPILKIEKAKDIFSYTPDMFSLEDYNPEPSIKFPIAV
jgi:thymidylate synthase